MTIPFRDTSGGKAIGGGALAPRTKRTNATNQVDSWRRGGAGVTPPVNIQYVIVAGGGGGIVSDRGGGGGAGGYKSSVTGELSGGNTSALAPLTNNGATLTVEIGAGGAIGLNGNNSFISNESTTVTVLGGGRAGNYAEALGPADFSLSGNGYPGGSGGGAVGRNDSDNPSGYNSWGTGTTGQGFRGGYSAHNAGAGWGSPGSGGGGAGQEGQKPPDSSSTGRGGGAGGNGIASSITGSSVYRAGGGGGGGRYHSGAAGAGGLGGGGTGSMGGGATAGSANTGGGGGGGYAYAAAGGSGVCVIRYLTAEFPDNPSGTTGSPVKTISGSYTVWTFNASGTITW